MAMTTMVSAPALVPFHAGLGGLSVRLCAAALLTISLAGCGLSLDPAPPPAAVGREARTDTKTAPLSEDYRLGAEHFNRGEYGLAERQFREAVEKSPTDANSWIGLAASYDRLKRFDLADRAYRSAIDLSGETAQILNNQGYSYLLRGNLTAARAKFLKARERDPDNPTFTNNLKLLDGGAKYMKGNTL